MSEVFCELLPEVKVLMRPPSAGHNPVNCGKPLKRFLPTCRGNMGKGQTNPLGMVKRETIAPFGRTMGNPQPSVPERG